MAPAGCTPDNGLLNAVNALLQGTKLGSIYVCPHCKLELEAENGLSPDCAGRLEELKASIRQAMAASQKGSGESGEENKTDVWSRVDNEIKRFVDDCLSGNAHIMSVYGEYRPESREVILYTGCLPLERCRTRSWFRRVLGETLAHEVIHHLQWTGASLNVDGKTFVPLVKLDDTLRNALSSVPYKYRPHEVEAFEKMAAVWEMLARSNDVRKTVDGHAEDACRICRCC